MDTISHMISDKAAALSLTPVTPPPTPPPHVPITQQDHTEVSLLPTPPIIPPIEKAPPTIPSHEETLTNLKAMIHSMKDQLDGMLRVIQGEKVLITKGTNPHVDVLETGEKVLEGVFNGQHMVGEDGKEYPVPPNYASKSKMVEGDLLKLTITNRGSFIYKQISPIERSRLLGELVKADQNEQWTVLAEGKLYKILTASITFHKGKPGDEVILLVPKGGMAIWGAVDNIVHKS
ncbi:MAG: hypothetical protein HOC34_03845 [Candidatus Magasanikbacteria bacterium]|jgi:hypothetical protein|nr:hypothetical protein [Candidatus Magasanikbacteria bacterium]MBT4221247.1 hypothetical protein [Candidatus Magasanikbacteria bacterium]MBT4350393.1 hypothetical protein [Candidatus Magasanikbacteria bacterium]MBT4542060.1 hypothetical protein [Candidatus Magasanikbacteria bacterium]MBT6253580.1 hypothetical protein [Candidatus Magasanikbacteria bacterium]